MRFLTSQAVARHVQHWAHHSRQWVARLADTQPSLHFGVAFLLALAGMAVLLAPFIGAAGLALNLILAGGDGQSWTLSQWPQWFLLAVLAWGGLWVARLRFPEPAGIAVDAKAAPQLYRWVDELRRELHASPIDQICLQENVGVQVVRSPKGGLPLTFRNVLVIGVPLMQCCSEQQLKAMVAGALGEVSLHNTGVIGWLLQLRSVWMQYHRVFAHSRHPLARLGQWFFRHYARWYAQIVLPLVTDRVLQRDQYAHLVVDESVLAESMAMEVIVPKFLDDYYWPQVFRSAAQSPAPTFKAFSNMGVVFGLRANNQNPYRWLRHAFAKGSDSVAGPTLKQRLYAIGLHEITLPAMNGVNAADSLLGDQQRQLFAEFDQRWQESVAAEWRMRYEQAQSDRNRLQMLEERIMQEQLNGKQAMEYAALTKRYGTVGQANAAYEKILAMNPGDPRINFGVGKYYLKQGDERGIPLLEKAMQMDKHCVPAACRLLSEHRLRSKDSEYKITNAMDDWLQVV